MVSIPLYIFLFIYFAFLAIFCFFSIVNILHMFQTGGLTFFSFVVTFGVTAVSIYVIFFTYVLLRDVSWQQKLELNIYNDNAQTQQYGI